MCESTSDPTVRRLRDEIAAVDRAILDAVNARLELVARLKSYKASQGIEFVDPEQERRLLAELDNGNRGPLSSDGLRELFGRLLELTKREVR
jgi:chorismate mutase